MTGPNSLPLDKIHRANHAVAGSPVQREHEMLSGLIEAADMFCVHPLVTECRESCAEDQMATCHRACRALGERMRDLMLRHFERESALMDDLRQRRDACEHCMLHRSEHVRWSVEFNQRVACGDVQRTAQGVRRLKSFVADWMRLHAAEFDMTLHGLARGRSGV